MSFCYRKGIRPSQVIIELATTKYISERTSVARISPSGRLSAGYLPSPKISESEARYDASKGLYVPYVDVYWDAWNGLVKVPGTREVRAPQLGLSAVANHHSDEPRRYGLKGITQNGKNKVYEGGKLLDDKYPGGLGFYTLTCPYSDGSLIYEFNRNIGEIQRQFFQTLKRVYDKKDCVFSYVSVTEVQSARYARCGEWVLHLHYVAPCYTSQRGEWVVSACELRDLWKRTVEQCIGAFCNTSASVDCQVVKKSASGYLAKYLSKGCADISPIADIAPSQCPRQWWSMSANVRKAIKEATTELPECIAEWYLGGNGRGDNGDFDLTYYKDIFIDWGGRELRVGMTGQLSRAGLGYLRDSVSYAMALEMI